MIDLGPSLCSSAASEVDGQVVTIGYDPHPGYGAHDVITFTQSPASEPGEEVAPDAQQTVEAIGGHQLTVVHRGGGCTL